MKRLTLLSVSIVLLTNLIYSQSVDVKDGDGNSLITINDEGDTGGSITIPDATTIGTPTNKLYNEGGSLKWNGSVLATGSSLWELNGGNIYYNGGYVGIGTSSPLSQLSVGDNGRSYATIYGYNINPTGFAGYFEGRGYFSGNVGIGTESPTSSLQVSGTTKIGTHTNVISITDIIEITGTTPSSGISFDISYPSDFTNTNTRVLSCEIGGGGGGSTWFTLGYYNSSNFSRVVIASPHITITFPDETSYHDAPFRLVLMKVS